MSKHTPEPWLDFVDCCEPATPHPDSDGVVRLGFEDYRRARVCVNVCEGLTTETLERMPSGAFIKSFSSLLSERNELERQLVLAKAKAGAR